MGATHITYKNGEDLGQGDSHKMLYSPKWLRVILEHVGFEVKKISDNIEIECVKP